MNTLSAPFISISLLQILCFFFNYAIFSFDSSLLWTKKKQLILESVCCLSLLDYSERWVPLWRFLVTISLNVSNPYNIMVIYSGAASCFFLLFPGLNSIFHIYVQWALCNLNKKLAQFNLFSFSWHQVWRTELCTKLSLCIIPTYTNGNMFVVSTPTFMIHCLFINLCAASSLNRECQLFFFPFPYSRCLMLYRLVTTF